MKSSEQNKRQCFFVLQGICAPGKLKNIPGYLNGTKTLVAQLVKIPPVMQETLV